MFHLAHPSPPAVLYAPLKAQCKQLSTLEEAAWQRLELGRDVKLASKSFLNLILPYLGNAKSLTVAKPKSATGKMWREKTVLREMYNGGTPLRWIYQFVYPRKETKTFQDNVLRTGYVICQLSLGESVRRWTRRICTQQLLLMDQSMLSTPTHSSIPAVRCTSRACN